MILTRALFGVVSPELELECWIAFYRSTIRYAKKSSTRDYGERAVRGRDGFDKNERGIRDGETCGWPSARSGGGSGWVKGIGQTKPFL